MRKEEAAESEDTFEEDEEVEDLAPVDEDDLEEDDEDEDVAADEEDEDEQASLEELLAQRAAGRKAGEEVDEEPDIMSLASEPDEPVVAEEPIPLRVAPVADQKEFVCSNCHLVKQKVQLADPERMRCRDCV